MTYRKGRGLCRRGALSDESAVICLPPMNATRFPRAVVDSVNVSDARNPELPFEASIWYHIDEARMAGSTFVSYRSYAFYPIAFFSNLYNLPPPGSRTQELRFAFPYSITGTERYRQPDAGTSSASLPAADSIHTLHFDLQKRFRRTHLAIVADWRLTAPTMKIPRSEYASYTRGAKDVREALDWTIAFHTSSAEETRDAVQSLVQEASRMDNMCFASRHKSCLSSMPMPMKRSG